ncbi:nucleotidyltransferase [Candidatus Omnitrophota bacterium]
MVFKFLITTLKQHKIDFAIIGGFALQAAGITRATRDIDLAVLSKDVPDIKAIMLKHGYELIHESEDILNFVGKKFELGRVDFLLAHRKYALSMLQRAKEELVLGGKFKIKVVRIEDLIGLKLQASANDPKRLRQDMADIVQLIDENRSKLDMNLVREYFQIFDRTQDLNDIIKEINDVKQ